MQPKDADMDADRMANSVDPDQMKEQSRCRRFAIL